MEDLRRLGHAEAAKRQPGENREVARPNDWKFPGWLQIAGACSLMTALLTAIAINRSGGCKVPDELRQASQLASTAQFSLAVSVSSAGLDYPNQCSQAHADLARTWYLASVQTVLDSARAGEDGARASAGRWAAIKQQASRYGVPPSEQFSSIQMAKRAYDEGSWAFAAALWEDAWQQGSAGSDAIEFHYATLRNWGRALAFADSATRRQEGVMLLSTAQAIATRYHLAHLEACVDLHDLGYGDCNLVADGTSDPLLVSDSGNG